MTEKAYSFWGTYTYLTYYFKPICKEDENGHDHLKSQEPEEEQEQKDKSKTLTEEYFLLPTCVRADLLEKN